MKYTCFMIRSKSIWLLFLVVFVVACKSKKGTTVSNPKEPTRKQREYVALSEKLNLEVDRNDNFKLYSFVGDWLSVPHKDGGCDKGGTDCSCFVRMIYEEAYQKQLPRNSVEMYNQSKRIDSTELKEGDLVFFKIKSTKISHVGIYLKDNWFAHVSSSKGVMINHLSEKYYKTYYAGAGRF